MFNPNWRQASAQGFYAGTESGSSQIANADTAFSFATNTPFQYRILIQEYNTADSNNTAIQMRLEYRKNGGTWTPVTTTSSDVEIVNHASLTQGDDTTQRIGSGTWVTDNNWVCDTSGTTNASGSTGFSDSEAECLWSIQIVDADVNNGDEIEFRATLSDGTTLDDYVTGSTFIITVQKPVSGAISEGIKGGDTFAATQQTSRAVSEGVKAGDTFSASIVISVSSSEGIKAGDTFSANIVKPFLPIFRKRENTLLRM